MKTNELLRRYADGRSEPAFEELVGRHIDLVYSAALRQVNGNVPAAQDVTQAVFTDLARKAPRLTEHTSLAGWLYTSTRYLAAKALRAEQCRRSHEQEAHEMNQLLQSTDPDTTWQELRPMLDEAMHDLNPTDREAVLMRYFERLPLAEIGARLGLKENAVHMRIERAIDRLRAALAKRGVTSTITALTALLTGRAVGGAPAGLALQVSRAAFGAAAAASGLGWGLLRLAGWLKGHALVAAGALALVAGLVVVPQWSAKNNGTTSTREGPGSTREPAAAPGSAAGAAVAGAEGPASVGKPTSSNGLVLHIVADDSGNPIAGATLAFIVRDKDAATRQLRPTEITADKFGVCEIPISRGTTERLILLSRTDGFVDASFRWSPAEGEAIPQQYTLRLETAAPIGGLVLDENGQPVAGAAVSVQTAVNSAPADSPYPPHITTEGAAAGAWTDAEGRWRIARFSRKAIPTLNVSMRHPDYVRNMEFAFMNDPEIEQSLLAGSYVYKLERGLSVSGLVVDTEGQPVLGAKVTAISAGLRRVTTNQPDGSFTLRGCGTGPIRINAEAQGFALASANLELTNNPAPLRLELARGNLLRLRVVDTNGTPVSNATVHLSFNRTAIGAWNRRRDELQRQTDASGRISWDGAPEGPLLLSIDASGYHSAINVQAAADGEEHRVTLQPARAISGSVRDTATGQPIPTFCIVTGEVEFPPPADGTQVRWSSSRTFHEPTFRFYEDDGPDAGPKKYKFQADGYAPFVTRAWRPAEGEAAFDVALYPAAGTTITVLSPDGQPATNAAIGLDIPGMRLNLKPGGFSPPPPGLYKNVFSADDAGRLLLPPDDTVTRVIAASPEGYAESTPAALAAEPRMRLQPWGRLEGTLLSGGKPAAGRVLTLGLLDRFFDVETDADGHFVFPKVPPGQFNLLERHTLRRIRGRVSVLYPVQIPPVTLRLGQTTTVSLALYNVTARLSLPAGVEMQTNWDLGALASRSQAVAGRPVWAALKESGDGGWVAEDLLAGDYTLSARVFDSAPDADSVSPLDLGPEGSPQKARLHAQMSFAVPSDPSSGTLDLGEIVLQPVQ